MAGSSATATALVADARDSNIPVDPHMAAHLIMPAVAAPFMAARRTACIPALSAVSITEATRGHFPRVAGRASVGVPMAEVSRVGRGMVGFPMAEVSRV